MGTALFDATLDRIHDGTAVLTGNDYTLMFNETYGYHELSSKRVHI